MKLIFSAHIYPCDRIVFSSWALAHTFSFAFVGSLSSVFRVTILGIGKVLFPLGTACISILFLHLYSLFVMKVSEFILNLPFLEEALWYFHTCLGFCSMHFRWKKVVTQSALHYQSSPDIFQARRCLFWELSR